MRKFAELPLSNRFDCEKAALMRFRSSMPHRILCAASIVWLATMLASCASDPKVLASPQVLLQSLRFSPNSELASSGEARILMHNFSNVPMTFTSMRGEFKLAGQFAAPISLDFALEIPAESPENVPATLALSPAALVYLNASQPIPYTLEGTITTIKPSRTFEFFYEGQLNPTPGVIGAWR